MRDRNRGAAEIKAVHQNAGHRAVEDLGAVQPFRPRDRGDHRHHDHHERHADRQIGQRFGAAEGVFGADEAGAPQHHKDRRGETSGRFLVALVHCRPSLPEDRAVGNREFRNHAARSNDCDEVARSCNAILRKQGGNLCGRRRGWHSPSVVLAQAGPITTALDRKRERGPGRAQPGRRRSLDVSRRHCDELATKLQTILRWSDEAIHRSADAEG